jgi:hypothetical protein
MTREGALDIAAKAFNVDQAKLKATLMFQPSKVSHIRAFPFWEVSLGERSIISTSSARCLAALNSAYPATDR